MAYVARRYAGYFDGVDDYVKVDSFKGRVIDKISVFERARFEKNVSSGAERLFLFMTGYNAWGTADEHALDVWFDGSNVYINIDDSVNSETVTLDISSVTVDDYKYHDFAVTVDISNNSIRCYIDGSLVVSGSFSRNYNPIKVDNPLYIGYRHQAAGGHEDFLVEYVWDRVLSDDEIFKLSEDPFDKNNVPMDGLVGWWDFNSADWENGILPDKSGNGNNGTMSGVVKHSVLVKRGSGDLPKWDLKYELINYDGTTGIIFDDGFDFESLISDKLGMAFIGQNYQHNAPFSYTFNENSVCSFGEWDSNEGAWHIPAGSEGLLFEKDFSIPYGGRLWRIQIRGKTSDSSVTDPVIRVEIVNSDSGMIYNSCEFKNSSFSDSSYSYMSLCFKEYGAGNYKYRVYVENVNADFWLAGVYLTDYHALVFEGRAGYRLYVRYGANNVDLVLWLSDGSVVDKSNEFGEFHDWFLAYSGYDANSGNFAFGWNGQRLNVVSTDYHNTIVRNKLKPMFLTNSFDYPVNSFIGKFASLFIWDRNLSNDEWSSLYNKQFILDGLLAWFVVDGDGHLVDVVSGNRYKITNAHVRELFDDSDWLNNNTGIILFDIIVDERGAWL